MGRREVFRRVPGVEEDRQREELESQDGGPHTHEIGAPVDEQSDDAEQGHDVCPKEAAAKYRPLRSCNGSMNVGVNRLFSASIVIEDFAGDIGRLFHSSSAVASCLFQIVKDE